MELEFRILGPLEALGDGRPLPLGAPKQRALLAVLLLRANEAVPASRLIDEIWGEEPPETALNILQGLVSDLRRALGRDVVETRGRGYSIRVEQGRLDLHRFERLAEEGIEALVAGRAAPAAAALREALALWRGPALADIADEPVARLAAGRLEELRLVALEKCIDADLVCARHAEVVAELQSLVANHPLRERLRAQLMLALYRSGRQAEALDAYRDTRSTLRDELGIEPGRPLQDLERAILRQEPSLDLGEAAQAQPALERAVLVVSLDEARLPSLLEVAEPLARRPIYELIMARLVADQRELTPATARLHEHRVAVEARGIVARAAAFTSTRPGEDIVRLASEQDVVLMLLDAPPGLLEQGVADADLAAVLESAPCDVALLAGGDGASEGAVLVPFGGVEHDWVAVELGAWLAKARAVPLRLVGAAAVPEAGKRDASRLLYHASLAVQAAVGVAAEPLLVPPGSEGILEASADAGLLVVGLSRRWHSEGLGPARLAIVREAKPPTLLVRRGLRPGGLAPRTKLTSYTWSIRAGS